MKWFFSMVVLVLPACAAIAPSTPPVPAAMAKSTLTPGILSLTGDELKQGGRTELSDALRASSPIFR